MQKVILFFCVSVLGVFICQQARGTLTTVNDVLLENVEALAEYENSLPILCNGSGNYSCPLDGDKYGFIYKGYSLR